MTLLTSGLEQEMASGRASEYIVLLKVLGEYDMWSPCVQEHLDSIKRLHLIQVG